MGPREAVVSGIVTPDEYVVDKKTKNVIDRFISEKNTMVVKAEDGIGTVEVKVEDELGKNFISKECLDKTELFTLIDYGLKIEEMYGAYQDIEWDLIGYQGALYLTI